MIYPIDILDAKSKRLGIPNDGLENDWRYINNKILETPSYMGGCTFTLCIDDIKMEYIKNILETKGYDVLYYNLDKGKNILICWSEDKIVKQKYGDNGKDINVNDYKK